MHTARRIIAIIIALATITSNLAFAEDHRWDPQFGRLGLSGRVSNHAVYLGWHQGDLYAAGYFTGVTDQLAGSVARWDGQHWHPLATTCDGRVQTLLFDGDDIYAAGRFTTIDGTPANMIARYDGSDWHPLGQGIDLGSNSSGFVVHALARFQGDLYAGGEFERAGDVVSPGLLRWDGSAWRTVGGQLPGVTGTVYSLAADANRLYVGGVFTVNDDENLQVMVAWDGLFWVPMGDGLDDEYIPIVYDLAWYDGQLHAGGRFESSGDTELHHLARWDGAAWHDVGGGVLHAPAPQTRVYDLAVDGATLHVSGAFDYAGDAAVAADNIASWNGATWSGYTGPQVYRPYVETIAAAGGDLYASSYFDDIDGEPLARIARWDGATWHSLCNVVANGLSNSAHCAVVDANGHLIVGGEMDTAGPLMVGSLARWDGTAWHDVGGGVYRGSDQYTARVTAMAMDASGNLYVGGWVEEAGGLEVNAITMWDGASWHDLGGGLLDWGSTAFVHTILCRPDGVYVGGEFNEAGGLPAEFVAHWNGAAWSALGAGLDDEVDVLVEFQGQVYAGGDFTGHVARWDGAAWQPVGAGFDDSVHDLEVHDGELYAAGQFESSGGTQLDGIARWDGGAWQPLDGGLEPFGGRSLFSHDGVLYVAGSFTSVGTPPQAISNLATWDGVSWGGLGSGVGPEYPEDFAVTQDRLFVLGYFSVAGGKPSSHVASWALDGITDSELPGPDAIWLAQNTPNPFNPVTEIAFELAEPGHVRLTVYDLAGRRMQTLVDGWREAREGGHRVTWTGRDDHGREAPSGIYLYRLESARGTVSRTMTLVR